MGYSNMDIQCIDKRLSDTQLRSAWHSIGNTSLSANVLLKVFNKILLFSNNFFDQVSYGDNTNDLVVFYNGKMTYMTLGHQLHAALRGFLWRDRNDRSAHDGAHRRRH